MFQCVRTTMSGITAFVLLLVVSIHINACFCIAPVHRAEYRQQSVRMIDDILQHETLPASVFWATCWTAAQNAAIFRTLNYPMTFLNRQSPISVTKDVNRNWVVIVVDLDCNWKKGWLAEVSVIFFVNMCCLIELIQICLGWSILSGASNTMGAINARQTQCYRAPVGGRVDVGGQSRYFGHMELNGKHISAGAMFVHTFEWNC